MFKKIKYLLILALLILFAVWIFDGDKKDSSNLEEPKEPNTTIKASQLIEKIYSHAKNGMLENLEVKVGKSQYDEVTKRLGNPLRIDRTVVGPFIIYNEPEITIGFQRGRAHDLRSYEESLKQIHYEDILNQLGDPDDINYYKDKEHNQIILIYQANENIELKWILNNPNEEEKNPSVHHISIATIQQPAPTTTTQELIEQMSIDEKIGQMIFAGVSGTNMNENAETLLSDFHVGGIILNKKNITSSQQMLDYMNALKIVNHINPIPLFFGIDQEGGNISKLPGDLKPLPSNGDIGQINNPSFSFEIGRILGKLVKAYGFNVNFAPVLDVNSNPNNPVIGDRSFGSDPNIVAELGIQTMKGLEAEKIIPTIKHFPGHGDTASDSHLELPTVNKTLEELEYLELVPFKRAIEAGADMVMVAHLLLPQIDSEYPSSISEKIITGLLRNRLDFDGVVITDDLTMKAITNHYGIGQAALLSVKAGSDIVMVAHNYDDLVEVFSTLKQAVLDGEISEARINESVERILKLKEKYKVADTVVENVDINAQNNEIEDILKKYMK